MILIVASVDNGGRLDVGPETSSEKKNFAEMHSTNIFKNSENLA